MGVTGLRDGSLEKLLMPAIAVAPSEAATETAEVGLRPEFEALERRTRQLEGDISSVVKLVEADQQRRSDERQHNAPDRQWLQEWGDIWKPEIEQLRRELASIANTTLYHEEAIAELQAQLEATGSGT